MDPHLIPVQHSSRNQHFRVRRVWCVVAAVVLSGVACGSSDSAESASSTASSTSRVSSTVKSGVTSSADAPVAPESTVPPTSTVAPSSSSTPGPADIDASPTTKAEPGPAERAVADAQELPLRKKLALLMFIGFNTGYRDTAGTTDPGAAQEVIDAGVGGVFIGRKELALFDSPVFPKPEGGEVNLLVATDAEGGRVDPLPQVAEPLPPARTMAGWPIDRVRTEAAAHGAELRAHGVNVNFAPMLDLEGGSNPLGDRTWSSEPDEVVSTAGAFSEGMCDAGVYPTFKHFPGHGRSDFDADLEPATTPDLATLEQSDLIPFRELTEAMKGRSMVMSGHLDVPGLTSEGRPFSIDPQAMAFLRDDVGFDGVVVTDELAEMGSITERGISVPDAVERSIVAGNDMALFFGGPSDLQAVLDHLERSVAEGRLSQQRVDESVQRVVTLMASGACSPS